MAKASKTNPISRLPKLKVYAYTDADEMARAKVEKVGQHGDNVDKDLYSGYAQCYSMGDRMKAFVFVAKTKGWRYTAIHEASHVVDKYFDMLSEDDPGTETRAYMVESVARCIIKQIEGR